MKCIILTAIIKEPYSGNEDRVESLINVLECYNKEYCNKGEIIYYEVFKSEYQGNEVIEVNLKIIMSKSTFCELMVKEIRSQVRSIFRKRLVTLVKTNGTKIN